MNLELAQRLTDLVLKAGAKEILLLGGEPTLWPRLLELNRYARGKISTTLVTNAIRFADDGYWAQYSRNPNDEIGVSLKASCEKKLKQVTSTTSWNTTLAGIQRALSLKGSGTSFVCSPDDYDIVKAATLVRDLGGDKLNINLYTPTCVNGKWESSYNWDQISEVLKGIAQQYEEAEEIMAGKLFLNGKFPVCVWPQEFITERMARGQISTGCQLTRRRGLIFDTDGSVLMCNHLQNYPIGKYGEEFSSAEELVAFLDEESIKQTYDQTSRFPSSRCEKCEDYSFCTGGCPILWTFFDPELIIPQEGR